MKELSTNSDDELVHLLRQNDESSFATIYNRFWKSLYLSAYNVLQERKPAEDAVQEVFISLWSRRHEVQIESLKSYLYQAVRFQVFKAIRAEKASRNFFERFSNISNTLIADQPLLFKELNHWYQNKLNSLPRDEQEIFRLHREQGFNYQQIADTKGISVKTVEKKMSRVLKHLRRGLDKAVLIVLVNLVK